MYSVAREKDAMRITHNKLDSQIESDISSCLADLVLCGIAVNVTNDQGVTAPKNDPLIDKAVELYCKAQADYQGAANRYNRAYESLRNAMQACGDYRL